MFWLKGNKYINNIFVSLVKHYCQVRKLLSSSAFTSRIFSAIEQQHHQLSAVHKPVCARTHAQKERQQVKNIIPLETYNAQTDERFFVGLLAISSLAAARAMSARRTASCSSISRSLYWLRSIRTRIRSTRVKCVCTCHKPQKMHKKSPMTKITLSYWSANH